MRTDIKSVVCVVAAIAVVFMFVPQALAKPESIVGGIASAFRKAGKGSVIEVRKRTDDKTYDIVLLKDDKIVMYTQQQGKEAKETTPVKTYNVEKIKAAIAKQANAAEFANGLVIKLPDIQQRRPVIRAITVRETDEGKIEFLVHIYDVGGGYKKSYVVETDTWTVKKDAIEGVNPASEEWSKEEGGEAASPAPSGEKGGEAGEAEAEPGAKAEAKAPAGEGEAEGDSAGGKVVQPKRTGKGLGGAKTGTTGE
jgi:hypothetical protein